MEDILILKLKMFLPNTNYEIVTIIKDLDSKRVFKNKFDLDYLDQNKKNTIGDITACYI